MLETDGTALLEVLAQVLGLRKSDFVIEVVFQILVTSFPNLLLPGLHRSRPNPIQRHRRNIQRIRHRSSPPSY